MDGGDEAEGHGAIMTPVQSSNTEKQRHFFSQPLMQSMAATLHSFSATRHSTSMTNDKRLVTKDGIDRRTD